MDKSKILKYYSRKEVQSSMLNVSKSREVSVRFENGGFGKRPDILQFAGDIKEFVKRGATSFHISEERWSDPLQLKPGMTKKQLDDLRIGWDLILDIDTLFWDYSKYTAFLLIEALKFHDIKNLGVKFSGNKGFHICVPFEAFPSEVNGKNTKDLFPESLRVIASYLQQMIKDKLACYVLDNENIQQIAVKAGKTPDELMKNRKFNPFSIIDIDTILISNRHLFRAPFSLHEKSGLASIPISVNDVLDFTKEKAKLENISFEHKFLKNAEENEAKDLIIQAFDWYSKKALRAKTQEKKNEEKEFEIPQVAISEEFFPPCISMILAGKMEDGKKRSIFILLNFLRKMGWGWQEIQKRLLAWNETHPEPLRGNYVLSQIQWHKRKKEGILPPNCSNTSYYKDLRICNPENLCKRIKNPVNFTMIKIRAYEENKPKLSKKKKKS
ncbi:MAG: DNA primase small subunit domain-containing protein [Nanoarchaeota archaeon]|nr:DNA primase small subunit domain-containing protein [Nanoarchaeota archaeon]